MSAILDTSQFDAALREYMAVSPKTFEEIINRKMYFVLRKAWEGTPHAERSKIEQDIKVIGYKLKRSKKTGKVNRGRAILGASVLVLLIQSRRAKAGLKGLYGKGMAKAVAKVAGARLRAAGTMRRGWLKSLLAFAGKSRDSVPSDAFTGRLPSGRGSAQTAEPGWNPTAEATFEVLIEKGARFDPRVEGAVQAAFDAEEASMRAYVEEKMNEEIRKVSA